MSIFRSIEALFDVNKVPVLSSTPPKELQDSTTSKELQDPAVTERIKNITNLRSQLSCEVCLTTNELNEHYAGRIKTLDLKNDYITAYHACKKNSLAICLFSDEIKAHFKNKTSIFADLKEKTNAATPSIASPSTLTLADASELSPARSDNSINSDNSNLTVESHNSDNSTLKIESNNIETLDSSSARPERSDSSNLTLDETDELAYSNPSPVMFTGAQVSIAAQDILPPIPIAAARNVKIEQRSTDLVTESPAKASANQSISCLTNVSQAARLAKRFMIEQKTLESFPKNLRPLVARILHSQDKTLVALIQKVDTYTYAFEYRRLIEECKSYITGKLDQEFIIDQKILDSFLEEFQPLVEIILTSKDNKLMSLIEKKPTDIESLVAYVDKKLEAMLQKECMIEEKTLESFPEEFRPLVEKILDSKDKALVSLIRKVHTHTLEDEDKKLVEICVAHVAQKLEAIVLLKQKFCESIKQHKLTKGFTIEPFNFMQSNFAEDILVKLANFEMSPKKAFFVLAEAFLVKTFTEEIKLSDLNYRTISLSLSLEKTMSIALEISSIVPDGCEFDPASC